MLDNDIRIGPGLASNLYDSTGHELDYTTLHRICPDFDGGSSFDCLLRNHIQTHVVYQPASRIPIFHLMLATGHLGLAAVALAVTWLIIRRTNLNAG